MVEDIHEIDFDLPEAFVAAFVTANGSAARMSVVKQFFDSEEITLGPDDRVELRPNESHQVYLVGSSSLLHIEELDQEDTLIVVQPVQGKRGATSRSALQAQIVSQMKQGRKLWLLTRSAATRFHSDAPILQPPAQKEPPPKKGDGRTAAVIEADAIVPDTSFVGIAPVKKEGNVKEFDVQAFGQLRTSLQNIRLQFWRGQARSVPTETVTVAAQKAEQGDLNGAIQAVEMLENGFVRLIEQWEHNFKETERKVKRGGADYADPNQFKNFKNQHAEMLTRINHTKTKFRLILNSLRELESEQKNA